MANPVTDYNLLTALKHYDDCENYAGVGRRMGHPRSTVQTWVLRARERNMDAAALGGTLAIGERIKGRSTLYGPDGDLKAEWVKTVRDRETENAVEAIKAAFDEYKGLFPKIPPPKQSDKDLLTVYPVADLHYGGYSWKEETGEDWDSDIAAKTVITSMGQLIAASPPSETAVILGLGDLLHGNDHNNATPQSKHALDIDTRHARVLKTGIELFIQCVYMALEKHKKVIIRFLPGNHDPEAMLAFTIAMSYAFQKEPRLTVDEDPSRFWCHQFGLVMLMASHGDKAKMADFPGIMASVWPVIWGATKYRYSFSGHFHHMKRVEKHGAVSEIVSAVTALDAYNAGYGRGS